jgi:HPt (histidine-containing phosphotransfer) domain-containing protein
MSNHVPRPDSISPACSPHHPRGAPILSTLSGDPDMLELIQLFVDEIPERARCLQDFWRRSEFAELRRIAHQLKGASGGYGFPDLGVAAGELERQLTAAADSSSTPDLSSVSRQVDELIDLCHRVRVC